MNSISKIIFLTMIFFKSSLNGSEIIIRQATHHDVPELIAFNHSIIDEHFKKTILMGYADSPISQNLELLNEHLSGWKNHFDTLFTQNLNSDNHEEQHLLVAINSQSPEKILGVCFSVKKNNHAYICYLMITADCRGKGVGSNLLTHTINLYNNIDSCALKTFAYANEKTHAFYEKHGFISDKKPISIMNKNIIHLDTIALICYDLAIKK